MMIEAERNMQSFTDADIYVAQHCRNVDVDLMIPKSLCVLTSFKFKDVHLF